MGKQFHFVTFFWMYCFLFFGIQEATLWVALLKKVTNLAKRSLGVYPPKKKLGSAKRHPLLRFPEKLSNGPKLDAHPQTHCWSPPFKSVLPGKQFLFETYHSTTGRPTTLQVFQGNRNSQPTEPGQRAPNSTFYRALVFCLSQ